MTTIRKKPILNQLRKYRRARGLRQCDAARVLGFADSSRISRWERGACLPTATNMFKLAALYRTLVDALYIETLREIREEVRTRERRVLARQNDHDR